MKTTTFILPLLIAGGMLAPPWADAGAPARVPNSTLLIESIPFDAEDTVDVVPAFPRLRFHQATFVAQVPDGSGDFIVLERTGVIWRFPNKPDPDPTEKRLFLNLGSAVETVGIEQGLLSMAFSPDYAANGQLYIHYTAPGKHLRLSRFTSADPMQEIDLATEEILINQEMPFTEHNGGVALFGNDGFLYFSIGDGGSYGDPLNNAQNTKNIMGTVIRIDVEGEPDEGLAYRIPPSNPFYHGGPDGTETRREIWAYGLRNPFRISSDPVTGRIFAGDVGQELWEEINLIERGRNYGWPFREGNQCYRPTFDCPSEGLTPPLVAHGRSEVRSITGGPVYRGRDLPGLEGALIYGDFATGSIRSLRYDDGRVSGPDLIANTGLAISCIAADLEGELLMVNFTFGSDNLYRLVPREASEGLRRIISTINPVLGRAESEDRNGDGVVDAADLVAQIAVEEALNGFPVRVSDLPAFDAAARGIDQYDAGIYSYEPISPLWSDGTHKERFLALPGIAQMEYREEGGFDMPEGTSLIKNFLLPMDERDPEGSLRRIETRLMLRHEQKWYGFSYKWNEDESDAVLVGATGSDEAFTITDADGNQFAYIWRYPSRTECFQCHTSADNFVLGVSAPQLDSDTVYTGSPTPVNQLDHYASLGLFKVAPPPAELRPAPMVNPHDASKSLQERARSYLASNCAACHQPGGPTPASIDLRWSTNNGAMYAVGVAPSGDPLGIANGSIIHPGDDLLSVLPARMGRRGGQQMPPLATSRIDEPAVALVREWISTLGTVSSDPWVAFANLHTVQWEPLPRVVNWADETVKTTDGALASFQNDISPLSHGGWRPKEVLDPLPAGRWRIRARIDWVGGYHYQYHPEARIFVRNATTGAPLATASHLDRMVPNQTPRTPVPRPEALYTVFDSDGVTPWRLEFETAGFIQWRIGGSRLLDVQLQQLPDNHPVTLQQPTITAPAPFTTIVGSSVRLDWIQPLGQSTHLFRIWRSLNQGEYENFEHGANPEELVGETTGNTFLVTNLKRNALHKFRVESYGGFESATSATVIVRLH